MIDTHSHLLPGIDDGCRTVEESLVCCRALVEAGYTDAFCTPHLWPNLPGNTVASIPVRVAELQGHLERAGIGLKLHAGGELNLRPNFPTLFPEELMTYSLARKYCLIDFWAEKLPSYFESAMKWMQGLGLTVIIAHPERLRAVQEDPSLADYFSSLGLLMQGNLQPFNDPISSPTRRTAELLLSRGCYFMLGSDTHNPGGIPDRLAGLRRVQGAVSEEEFTKLTRVNPGKLMRVGPRMDTNGHE